MKWEKMENEFKGEKPMDDNDTIVNCKLQVLTRLFWLISTALLCFVPKLLALQIKVHVL